MQLPAVDLADPLRDVIEEVPVVRDGQHGARVRREELLEPQHRLGVEVVGGLVEEQQVGLAQQQLAQRDTAALTTGEVGDGLVRRRAAQRVHGLLELRVEIPRVGVIELLLELAHLLHQLVGVVGGHELGDFVEAVELDLDLAEAFLDVLLDRLLLVEGRLLLEDADGGLRIEEGLAVAGLIEPGHDLENRRLARAVGSDDADLRAVVEAHGDVIEDDLVTVRLAHLLHRVNELRHDHQRIGRRSITHIVRTRQVGPAPESGRCRSLRPGHTSSAAGVTAAPLPGSQQLPLSGVQQLRDEARGVG